MVRYQDENGKFLRKCFPADGYASEERRGEDENPARIRIMKAMRHCQRHLREMGRREMMGIEAGNSLPMGETSYNNPRVKEVELTRVDDEELMLRKECRDGRE